MVSQDRRHLFVTPCVVIYEEAVRDSFRTLASKLSKFSNFFGAPFLGMEGNKSNKNDENFLHTVENEIRNAPSAKQSSLGRYVFGSEISYNKPPPRLPGLGC